LSVAVSIDVISLGAFEREGSICGLGYAGLYSMSIIAEHRSLWRTHLLAMERRGSSRKQQLTERSVTVALPKMAHLDDEVWDNQAIGRVLSAFEKWGSGSFLHFHQSRAADLTISFVHCSSSPYDQCHRFDCCSGFNYPSLCLSKRSLPF
jgi:hypothetical protein